MRRIAVCALLASVVALLSGANAVPARAVTGTTQGDCSTGSSCQVILEKMVTFNGSYSRGTSNTVVDVTPPPCLWNPIGDATTGSQAIIADWGSDPANAPTQYQISQSVQQADDLLKNPVTGEWYELPVNPAAGTAGAAECLKLPLYVFVPPGQPLPGVNIPPATLAQLAFAVLNTPQAGNIILNPTATSDVNLPTFVNLTLAPPANTTIGKTADGHAWVGVTASLAGQDSATVWAESSSLVIDPGTKDATIHDGADCSTATVTGGDFTLGSKTSPAAMAATTANQPIDCGVTYHVPSAGTFTLQASIGWTACWADTGGATTPPRAPSFADCQNNPVPGAANLTPSIAQKAIAVQEIQSVNGG